MNSFGALFRVTTAGESHGPAMTVIVDGCPAGIELSEADIQIDLDRRRPGASQHVSTRQEKDQVSILSGVFLGKTTGTPITLLIDNQDARSQDYEPLKNTFRPGHADYTYHHKYGHRDYRGGGRASARETVLRVAAGAIAKKMLQTSGIGVRAYAYQIGEFVVSSIDLACLPNELNFPDRKSLPVVKEYLARLRQEGNSVGAAIKVLAMNVPVGLGEPIYDKLDARLASAMMSINAAKGVEIGAGFASVTQTGAEHRDELAPSGFLSNHAGGVVGGISSGQSIEVNVAFKPASSIAKVGNTVTLKGEATQVSVQGRHDPCVGIRAVPICEAMMALVLADFILLHRARKKWGENNEKI